MNLLGRLIGGVAGATSFPYNVGEVVPSFNNKSLWSLHKGTKKVCGKYYILYHGPILDLKKIIIIIIFVSMQLISTKIRIFIHSFITYFLLSIILNFSNVWRCMLLQNFVTSFYAMQLFINTY